MINRVVGHKVFPKLNDLGDTISVADSTKICVNGQVYAIVGYHCEQILAVKIGEEIIDGTVSLYIVRNAYSYDEKSFKWVNRFRVEKSGIVNIEDEIDEDAGIEDFFYGWYEVTDNENDFLDTHDSYNVFRNMRGSSLTFSKFRAAEKKWLEENGITKKTKVRKNGLLRNCYVGVKISPVLFCA